MIARSVCFVFFGVFLIWPASGQARQAPRNCAFTVLEGQAEDFAFTRDWSSYYWREDFAMLVRDDSGTRHRVISREPTPWNDYRLGTTFTGLTVAWANKPRVQVIGVRAIDRQPERYYELKLNPKETVTAFIVRVHMGEAGWKDYFINNWFHKWGAEADRKILPYYARRDKNYDVYGYVTDAAAPFAAAGKQTVAKAEMAYSGLIYRGRIVSANNDLGYEIRLLNLMGRHKKSLDYEVFHGDTRGLVKLDGRPPAKK